MILKGQKEVAGRVTKVETQNPATKVILSIFLATASGNIVICARKVLYIVIEARVKQRIGPTLNCVLDSADQYNRARSSTRVVCLTS